MTDIEKTKDKTQQAQNADRNPFSAAIAGYKALPIGLRRIVKGTVLAAGILIAVTALHPNLSKAVFLTGSLLNLFVIVAVIIQAYIYIGQWDVMERQWKAMSEQTKAMAKQTEIAEESLKVARDSLARGNRPSIGVNGVNIVMMEVGQPVKIEIVWRNTGTNIAHHVRSDIRIEGRWDDAPDPKFAYQGMKSRGALGINAIAITPVFSNIPLPQGDWDHIRRKTQWLFLYAMVTYENGIGEEYFTQFTGRYNHELKGFETCGDFNEAS